MTHYMRRLRTAQHWSLLLSQKQTNVYIFVFYRGTMLGIRLQEVLHYEL